MIRKDKPNPYINTSGTLSVSSTITGSVDVFDKQIETWKSVVQANPTLSEYINPAIDKLTEIKNYVYEQNWQLLDNKKTDLDYYKEIIDVYEDKINKSIIEEKEMQDFFENNPLAKILLFRDVKEFIPKKSFGGEKYPDFVAILYNGEHILIELEKPTDRLYNKDGNPTAKFNEAEHQIQSYISWVNEEKDFLRKKERDYPLPNISIENTRGLLIIGMKKNLTPSEINELDKKRYYCQKYNIKTFDEILFENKEYLNSITKKP